MEDIPPTTQCAWCKCIKHDALWHSERRARPVTYSHGICPKCRGEYFRMPTEGDEPYKSEMT
jgi:hypothetical protein